MNLLLRAAAVAALVLPLAVAPAQAQDFRTAIGLNGGIFGTTNVNRGDNLESLRFGPSFIVGAQLEHWLGGTGRFGLRLNFGYSDAPFNRDDADETFGNVNTYLADLNLLTRLATPSPDRRFAPFLNLGIGVVHYNPGGDHEGITMTLTNAQWLNDPETMLAGVVGLGADLIASPRIFVRVEGANHIAFESPMHEAGTTDRFGAVHNLRGTLGLHLVLAPLFPPPVVVAPPPPPPAPPPPAPPPPVEETIAICVVDPAAPGGLRTVETIHLPETRDTLVVVEGERVPFRTVVPEVTVVGDTDWYVEGRPLTARRIEFVTFGAPRVIDPQELAFLGMLNGLPIYASRVDVDPALAAEPGADLRARLEERADARRAFQQVEVLYAPADVVGCVFVPLQRVEEIIKVRG